MKTKWQAMSELIARMPGGRLIGDAWKGEAPVKVVFYNIEADTSIDSTEPYSFSQNLLIAAVNEYGPLEEEGDDWVMRCPRLVGEMLEFWADEFTWTCDTI